jgi:glycosyltransferase involved in cell wall biosynthesis
VALLYGKMTQKSRRILVFTTAYRPLIGGSELALEEIIRRLPNVFFDIITPRYNKEFKALELGENFCIYRVGPGSKLSKIFFPLLGFLKAEKLIRSNNYDAIHAYQASYGGGAAWLTKIFHPHIFFILTLQEGKNLNYQSFIINWLRSLIIKRADIVTVISRYLEEYVKEIIKFNAFVYKKIENCQKNKKIMLIPNGVDLQKFQMKNDKLQIKFKFQNPNQRVIISISRLVPKNGLTDLIKAFNLLNTKYNIKNIKLVIIGDGDQREELFNLVSNLKLGDKVEFIGSISNDKIYEYLSLASVFVRPSLSEGLGTAFLEAMAVGLPVIGTPVGGIPDFLKEGETGLFCRVGDPEDLAEKINKVLTDDKLKNKLILNARKLVEEKYTWDKVAKKFRDLYDQCQ